MPRAIWSGAISFGLVNVPVKLFSAVREHKLHFNYIHEKDGSPIGYSKFCKAEDKSVPDDEIVKAFEWKKGEFVPMADEDFEAAQAHDTQRLIEIRDFVEIEEIDPIFFERTYYLVPDKGADKSYALLMRAMSDSGKAAIAKFVMRDRQNLGCLRVRDGVIALERMYFADEVVPADDVAPDREKVDKRELDMAKSLIERLAGDFDPGKYEDTYRDALCEIIKAKRKGETIEAPALERPKEVPDLMSALEASLERAKHGDGRRNGRRRDGAGSGDLEQLSKQELYELARTADIAGRADMSKGELVKALVKSR
jgi:DNA end-binding protein Ku